MPFSRERLIFLLETYSNRKTTEAEDQELFSLISGNDFSKQPVHAHIQQLVEKFNSRELVPAVNWEQLYQRINENIIADTVLPEPVSIAAPPRRFPWFRMLAAALIILLLGISAFYLIQPVPPPAIVRQLQIIPSVQTDVLPGTAGAILTLSNGRQIVLDSSAAGTQLTQGNTKLLNHQGRLSYNIGAGAAEAVYNTMTTTKGKQYQLQLSDGSKIWLNAASSVTFPTAFTGNERKISITGEAYFEIAHDAKKPFTVSTNGIEIQVLGTSFNVNAYDDEDNTSTTLLEGSVKIINQHTTVLLAPGQQAQLNHSGKIKLVNDADVQEAVAWKDGLFVMKKAGIASIMRQIARWYDVQVSYSDGIPAGRISGDIPRTMNLSKVLEVMELSGVHFALNEKKVIVKP
ncbi:MAG: FecR domain-containing protein [Chitinophagaceae bacterium]